jgi:hypothetical protein
MNDTPYIWEGKTGEPSRPVKSFNLETRRTVDREATDHASRRSRTRSLSRSRPTARSTA